MLVDVGATNTRQSFAVCRNVASIVERRAHARHQPEERQRRRDAQADRHVAIGDRAHQVRDRPFKLFAIDAGRSASPTTIVTCAWSRPHAAALTPPGTMTTRGAGMPAAIAISSTTFASRSSSSTGDRAGGPAGLRRRKAATFVQTRRSA